MVFTTGPGASSPDMALFCDFDGTLVEIALTPDAIHVPVDTADLIRKASADFGGAFALVSGRAIADLERHLGPMSLAMAGSHGAERRLADGERLPVASAARSGAMAIAATLAPLVAANPGLMLEKKPGAVALHYRQSPELEESCRSALRAALTFAPGFTILAGKMVLEARPIDMGKGAAIRAFMQEEPFRDRRPIFIGDDTTDEDGFAAVQELGGTGIKVGEGPTAAKLRVENVAAARAVIRQLGEEAARRNRRTNVLVQRGRR